MMPYFKRIFPFHKYAFSVKVEIVLHIRQYIRPKDPNPTLDENFENLGVIEKHEYLNNQDELGLETSCIMLVHPASL